MTATSSLYHLQGLYTCTCTAFFFLLLLNLKMMQSASAATTSLKQRRARVEELHPVHVLSATGTTTTTASTTTRGEGGVSATPGEAQEVREQRQLVEDLSRRLAVQGADVSKPSVRYILELFARLEKGAAGTGGLGLHRGAGGGAGGQEGLAGGSSGGRTMEVIRGITPTVSRRHSHYPKIILSFPLTVVTGYDGAALAELTLAELRIRSGDLHNRVDNLTVSTISQQEHSGVQRVRVRVLDSSGVRQLEQTYRIQWRLEDMEGGTKGYRILNITQILLNLSSSRVVQFKTGTIQLVLRRIQQAANRARDVEQRHPRSAKGYLQTVPGLHSLSNNVAANENSYNLSSAYASPLLQANDVLIVVYTKSTNKSFLDNKLQSSLSSRQHLHSKSGFSHHQNNSKAQRVLSRNRTMARQRRRKRHSLRMSKSKQRCTVMEMQVDFSTFGWTDDIVHPHKYNANICVGKCPSPVDPSLNTTNHAILQSMLRIYDKKTRRPCCVPVTLKPLMMIYRGVKDTFFKNGDIEIRTHPDMVVQDCGCR